MKLYSVIKRSRCQLHVSDEAEYLSEEVEDEIAAKPRRESLKGGAGRAPMVGKVTFRCLKAR